MNNAFAILRLFWSPRSLAVVAMEVSNPLAILASAIAIDLGLATLGAVFCGSLTEPFPSPVAYVQECVDVAWRIAGLLGVVFTPWVILFIAIFKDAPRSRGAAESRAVILSSIVALPALALWSVFSMMAHVQHLGFGLLTGKPTWIMSPVIGFLGSIWWLPVGVVAVAVDCERATREVKRTFREVNPSRCVECSYCLKGLSEPRCPECGQEFLTSAPT